MGVPGWNFGTALQVRRMRHEDPWTLSDTAGLMDSLLVKFGERVSDNNDEVGGVETVIRAYESSDDAWITIAAATVNNSHTYLFALGCPIESRISCEILLRGILSDAQFTHECPDPPFYRSSRYLAGQDSTWNLDCAIRIISANPVEAPRINSESTGNLNLGVPQKGNVDTNARRMKVSRGQLRFQDLTKELRKKNSSTGIHMTDIIISFLVNEGSYGSGLKVQKFFARLNSGCGSCVQFSDNSSRARLRLMASISASFLPVPSIVNNSGFLKY